MIGVVGKMPTDQRGGDQLYHGIAGDTTLAEIHDLALAEALHPDELTQLNDVAFNTVRVTDKIGIAIVEIDGGAESPCLTAPHHVLDRSGRSRRGVGW